MKSWIFWIWLVLGTSAFAQGLLPNGQQQFTDSAGVPLVGGQVYFYAPGTTAPKFTYQDSGLTVPNGNPVILNSAGRAQIWGSGLYREIVYDSNGNLIWDAITGVSSGGGGSLPVIGGALQLATPTSGSSVVMTTQDLRLTPAGTLAALTVFLPVGFYDGEVINIICTKNVTALTLSAAATQAIDPGSAVTAFTTGVPTAGESISFKYVLNVATWYRVR